MGDEEATLVQEAFATNWIAPLGPHVDKFEAEFVETLRADTLKTETGSNQLYAAAVSSGTAALHLALRMLGVGAGDEVFVSTLTFSASVNPIAYERAQPVFIDSERASWNMDPQRLQEAFEDRAKKGRLPKAVIVVHLYGQSANLDSIVGLCEQYQVPLIEDAAEALGAVYYSHKAAQNGTGTEISQKGTKETTNSSLASVRNNQVRAAESNPTNHSTEGNEGNEGRAQSLRPSSFSSLPSVQNGSSIGIAPGTVGRMGIFSFNGNKIITTSGGGMLVSPDEALIKKARFLATQARDPAPHYQHSEIGFNYRMSNVLAGIGRGQLRVLADRVEARRANCAFYQKAFADLPGIEFMPEPAWSRSTRWLTCILVDPGKFGADREQIRLALEAENIESRPVWKPMHLQPVFADCDAFGGEVAEDLFARGLCLPSGSNLTESDLQRVVDVVRKLQSR